MHSLIFFNCVDTLDGCEGKSEPVKNKDVFYVDHASKALMVTGSLSLQPIKDLFIPILCFIIKKSCGFLLRFSLILSCL